jgi:hypothetical protein
MKYKRTSYLTVGAPRSYGCSFLICKAFVWLKLHVGHRIFVYEISREEAKRHEAA